MRVLALVALLAFGVPPTGADVIVETDSGQEFPARVSRNDPLSGRQIELRATGAALSKWLWRKQYAACFYISAEARPGEPPYARFIDGDFDKLLVLRFLRDTEGKDLAETLGEHMRPALAADPAPTLASFLALLAGDFAAGQELSLSYAPEQGLGVYCDGQPLGSVEDRALIRALWVAWFGDDPVSTEVKKGLAGL
ncbi:hypothetical protein FJ251_02960 [bacterium]|nr:hypothetical protein [bacterium]